MYFKKVIGKSGEKIACEYLKLNNYKIMERNYSCYQGEIDIIAKDCKKNELVFIEVKTRTNKLYGRPIDAIDKNKKRHIYNSCKYYLYKNRITNCFIRIDAIEIYFVENKSIVNHIKQII
mgnify:FL=1